MILSITGEARLRVVNFEPNTVAEGTKMPAAELVVENLTVPCVIRKVVYGNIEALSEQTGNVSLMIFNRLRHTPLTRQGFVDVQITTKPVQFFVYIHADQLERFLGVFAMSTVRAGLDL